MTPAAALALALAVASLAGAAEGTPAWRGMGPLVAALAAARKEWKPDACLAGMSYGWSAISRFEVATGKGIPDSLERYSYAFLSPSDRAANFAVVFRDNFDMISKIDRDQRETELWPRTAQHSRCLTEVAVDAGQAMRIAEKRGLTVWDRRDVDLAFVSLPETPEESVCEVPDGRGLHPKSCRELKAADRARLRSLAGRQFWIVSTKAGAVYIDAAKGRFLFRILVGD